MIFAKGEKSDVKISKGLKYAIFFAELVLHYFTEFLRREMTVLGWFRPNFGRKSIFFLLRNSQKFGALGYNFNGTQTGADRLVQCAQAKYP